MNSGRLTQRALNRSPGDFPGGWVAAGREFVFRSLFVGCELVSWEMVKGFLVRAEEVCRCGVLDIWYSSLSKSIWRNRRLCRSFVELRVGVAVRQLWLR